MALSKEGQKRKAYQQGHDSWSTRKSNPYSNTDDESDLSEMWQTGRDDAYEAMLENQAEGEGE